MATNWVDEVLSGATSTGSKTLSLATGNALSVANSSSESIFTVTSDTTNGGYTSILGIEGQEAVLFLGADNADDAGDAWEIHSDTSGNLQQAMYHMDMYKKGIKRWPHRKSGVRFLSVPKL